MPYDKSMLEQQMDDICREILGRFGCKDEVEDEQDDKRNHAV